MKKIVFYNASYIYIPEYDITFANAEQLEGKELSVSMFKNMKEMSASIYTDTKDRSQSMKNILHGLREAGYELIKF